MLNDTNNNSSHLMNKLEKGLGEHRYLRQGKAIRQVASSSSLCQQFPYAPFNAMVTKISKWSRIKDSCRITPKITGSICDARHSLKISEISVHNFLSYLANTQTNRQTDKQTKTGKNITSLAEVNILCTLESCSLLCHIICILIVTVTAYSLSITSVGAYSIMYIK